MGTEASWGHGLGPFTGESMARGRVLKMLVWDRLNSWVWDGDGWVRVGMGMGELKAALGGF